MIVLIPFLIFIIIDIIVEKIKENKRQKQIELFFESIVKYYNNNPNYLVKLEYK
jgi:hypothetical protein